MGLSRAGSKIQIALVASLALILIVLAVLQFRWSGQISEADRERIQSSLDTSILQFRLDFYREMLEIAASFQPGRPPRSADGDWRRLATRHQEWVETTPYPELVSGLYFWQRSSNEASKLMRLGSLEEGFVETQWPERFLPLREAPWRRLANPRRLFGESRGLIWFIFPQIPVLVHPVYAPTTRENRRGSPPEFQGYVVVELNKTVLANKLFSDLAQRYFSGPQGLVYQIMVIRGTEAPTTVYQSHPELQASAFSTPDARMALLLQPREFLARERTAGISEQRQLQNPNQDASRSAEPPPSSALARMLRRRGPSVLTVVGEEENWQLLVRHTEGSLDAVVAHVRRRNLAISFGILLLLALSMTMIILLTQRAKRLAKLQMEFVAGVSHELRTPLTVICSAGENLADGVVSTSGQQVKQYGELVLAEGRRLASMVEQILQFAKVQAGRKVYNLHPARVEKIIEDTLKLSQPMIDSAGFTLERDIPPNLPMVRIDAAALSQCLQNLLSNALKYGGENKWLRISAASSPTRNNAEIQISIEDRGMGIEPTDLPHIFEPFYRGSEAISAQIHGSGLGLSMARDAIRAMGGKIEVKSSPGSGSTFTIHIPVMSE